MRCRNKFASQLLRGRHDAERLHGQHDGGSPVIGMTQKDFLAGMTQNKMGFPILNISFDD
ncbi:hypothetical protein [Sphingobacterium hungaricum]